VLRAYLDPDQSGLDDEARQVLRYLRERQEEHLQYEELAVLIGGDRTNAGRKVKRLLLERLSVLWNFPVRRVPGVEHLVDVLTEHGARRRSAA
jgi:hypothetical protein